VRERDKAAVGEGDLKNRGGKGGAGRVAVVGGLTVDVPGDGPDLGGAVLQQAGVAHLVFEEGARDGGEGCDRDKEVRPGREPGRAVCGEATAGHHGMDGWVVLELSAPGVQHTGAPREVGPEEALVCGEPFAGERRGVEQGVVRKALMGSGCRV
jgi:hypothetical protein